jgi:hypothetical protein
MANNYRRPHRDGFHNMVDPTIKSTIVAEGVQDNNPPVLGDGPMPPVFDDPNYDVNYGAMDCETINGYVGKLNTLISSSPSGSAQFIFYSTKLVEAQAAAANKCNPRPGSDPIGTNVHLPPGSTLTVGPGYASNSAGGGGGGGGSASGTPAAKKKTQWWWLLAAAAVFGVAMYNTTD